MPKKDTYKEAKEKAQEKIKLQCPFKIKLSDIKHSLDSFQNAKKSSSCLSFFYCSGDKKEKTYPIDNLQHFYNSLYRINRGDECLDFVGCVGLIMNLVEADLLGAKSVLTAIKPLKDLFAPYWDQLKKAFKVLYQKDSRNKDHPQLDTVFINEFMTIVSTLAQMNVSLFDESKKVDKVNILCGILANSNYRYLKATWQSYQVLVKPEAGGEKLFLMLLLENIWNVEHINNVLNWLHCRHYKNITPYGLALLLKHGDYAEIIHDELKPFESVDERIRYVLEDEGDKRYQILQSVRNALFASSEKASGYEVEDKVDDIVANIGDYIMPKIKFNKGDMTKLFNSLRRHPEQFDDFKPVELAGPAKVIECKQ